ncbi:alpha/beta fold hydrolase [Streptomyces sp. NPDC001633]|uniref:alpha/beta fold hydrolase n=1 Tax=Streptomyces sp. NPDC001633 TaxID=3364595 RepID=UPI0036BF34E1
MSTLTIPAGDTHLHAVDTSGGTSGGTPPLVFVNGGFATLRSWDRVLKCLADAHRTVRYDARARGKSGTSSDYSFRTAVDDVGRVIAATGVERPILVGWSHGATTAVRYAAQHPGEISGLVLVDGGFPISMFDDAGKQRVRTQFRRLGPLMRLAALLGRSARMTPAQAADLVIELDEVNGTLEADFATLNCPATFVLGTGGHSGASAQEMATLRASAARAEQAGRHVSTFTTAPANHLRILAHSPDLVASAVASVVEQTASTGRHCA